MFPLIALLSPVRQELSGWALTMASLCVNYGGNGNFLRGKCGICPTGDLVVAAAVTDGPRSAAPVLNMGTLGKANRVSLDGRPNMATILDNLMQLLSLSVIWNRRQMKAIPTAGSWPGVLAAFYVCTS